MNTKQRTYKGFTLIELLVAIGIFAMVLSFATVIFQASVDSYRTATANTEIMQKLRAITNQLNRDFKGFRKDAPIAFAFDVNDAIRSDRIVFFSNGDFQSVRQYRYKKSDGTEALKTISGNVARIYYGQSSEPAPNTNNPQDFRKVILARKLQILTADDTLYDTDLNNPNDPNEYTKLSLSQWILRKPPQDDDELSDWIGRPNVRIDSGNPEQIQQVIPMYMAEGVHNFTIEWFDGFDGGQINWQRQSGSEKVSTKALKFTFTLYDSKGVIKNGRTFTHIVYLDN